MFVEDAGIDPRFRSSLAVFKGSGYDRGHMAPAANHKGSQRAMDETFVLSNASPQVGAGFNRDYWARFERFVQELSYRCSDVWVATGPLYLPSPGREGWAMNHPMLGERMLCSTRGNFPRTYGSVWPLRKSLEIELHLKLLCRGSSGHDGRPHALL